MHEQVDKSTYAWCQILDALSREHHGEPQLIITRERPHHLTQVSGNYTVKSKVGL